jgi:hypothetical protein
MNGYNNKSKLMKSKKSKGTKKELPKVTNELKGLDFEINNFGEINMTMDIDKINEFLNKNVDDKKLRESDSDGLKKEKK